MSVVRIIYRAALPLKMFLIKIVADNYADLIKKLAKNKNIG